VQIPHAFFARKAKEAGFKLPNPGEYAVGALFMPRDPSWREVIKSIIADKTKSEGLTLLGWRDVPTDNSSLGETVKPTEPYHMQVFIGCGKGIDQTEFERRLYILRKVISNAIYQRRERALAGYYPVSISCRTVVYKGMFLADQLGKYYPDLHEPDFETALAWCTSAFPPTPSRRGSWRIPTAWWRITARSTRCAAMSTGWRRGRRRSIRSCSATTSPSCGRSPTRASRTRPASTTRSNS